MEEGLKNISDECVPNGDFCFYFARPHVPVLLRYRWPATRFSRVFWFAKASK